MPLGSSECGRSLRVKASGPIFTSVDRARCALCSDQGQMPALEWPTKKQGFFVRAYPRCSDQRGEDRREVSYVRLALASVQNTSGSKPCQGANVLIRGISALLGSKGIKSLRSESLWNSLGWRGQRQLCALQCPETGALSRPASPCRSEQSEEDR